MLPEAWNLDIIDEKMWKKKLKKCTHYTREWDSSHVQSTLFYAPPGPSMSYDQVIFLTLTTPMWNATNQQLIHSMTVGLKSKKMTP